MFFFVKITDQTYYLFKYTGQTKAGIHMHSSSGAALSQVIKREVIRSNQEDSAYRIHGRLHRTDTFKQLFRSLIFLQVVETCLTERLFKAFEDSAPQ